tara:strand:- start:156930 stop:157064 length:135 start_codon:yes stop_codon:yes gene_type:complete
MDEHRTITVSATRDKHGEQALRETTGKLAGKNETAPPGKGRSRF